MLFRTVVGETRGVMLDDQQQAGGIGGEFCVPMLSAAAIVLISKNINVMFFYIPNTIYLFLDC